MPVRRQSRLPRDAQVAALLRDADGSGLLGTTPLSIANWQEPRIECRELVDVAERPDGWVSRTRPTLQLREQPRWRHDALVAWLATCGERDEVKAVEVDAASVDEVGDNAADYAFDTLDAAFDALTGLMP